jgi:M6 family metalloprotease-like protein
MPRLLFVIGALLALVRVGAAQDVVEIGRQHGTPVPLWIQRELTKNSKAFEFQRAWKSALETAKANRTRLTARGTKVAAFSSSQAVQYGTAVSGTYRVPVIPVLYANTATAPYPSSTLQSKFFATPSATPTVSTFYTEMSRGLLTMTGTVADWVRVSQNDTYYEGADSDSLASAHIGALLKETLDIVDQTIDFSQYDRDGDGFVDFVAFVQPKAGRECGIPGVHSLWTHRWNYGAVTGTFQPYQSRSGVKISDYVLLPALNCDSTAPLDIGVFAHELGHALGLPDLYATNYSNAGISQWGLMGTGNMNRRSSPAYMEAWSRVELGWLPVTTISVTTPGVTIRPAETDGSAIRINIPNTSEYFLLENRQRLGSDQYLKGTGLLVWHVDSVTMAPGLPANTVQNTPSHKALDLEEADGTDLDLPSGVADAGDPFPGSAGNHSFTPVSAPNSNAYSGIASGVWLTNIVEANGVITLDVTIGTPGTHVATWGDVTDDGAVTLEDVQAMYDELVGKASGYAMTYADVDGNGRFDARDALIAHSFVAGGVDVSQFRVGRSVSILSARQRASAQRSALASATRSLGMRRPVTAKPLPSESRAAVARPTQRDH